MAIGMNQKTHIRIKRPHERLFAYQPCLKLLNAIAQLSENSSADLDARNAGIRKRHITQVIDSLPELANLNFGWVKGQIKTSFQKISNFILKQSKIFIVMVKNNKIIRIAKIIFSLELVFYKLIKLVHINIGEKLGCKVSYRRAFNAGFLIGIGSKTFDDNFHQIHQITIFDSAADNFQKNLVINGRKELANVALESKTYPSGLKNFTRIYAKPLYSFMCSLIFSARIRIGNKGRFKNRVKETKNRVMDDPITDSGLMDMPQLWIMDIKIDI